MPSDKERREIARKLRERTKKPMGKSMQRMFTETLDMYTRNICWMNPDKATSRWDVIVNYLADLIDPPTCTVVKWEQLVTQGLDELDLDDMFRYDLSCGHEVYGRETPRHCSVCGAEVIGDDR